MFRKRFFHPDLNVTSSGCFGSQTYFKRFKIIFCELFLAQIVVIIFYEVQEEEIIFLTFSIINHALLSP